MRAFDLSDKGVYTQTKDWKAADWIHVENPSDDDVEDLIAIFGIPKDYILDSLDEYEIPRQEKVKISLSLSSSAISVTKGVKIISCGSSITALHQAD